MGLEQNAATVLGPFTVMGLLVWFGSNLLLLAFHYPYSVLCPSLGLLCIVYGLTFVSLR